MTKIKREKKTQSYFLCIGNLSIFAHYMIMCKFVPPKIYSIVFYISLFFLLFLEKFASQNAKRNEKKNNNRRKLNYQIYFIHALQIIQCSCFLPSLFPYLWSFFFLHNCLVVSFSFVTWPSWSKWHVRLTCSFGWSCWWRWCWYFMPFCGCNVCFTWHQMLILLSFLENHKMVYTYIYKW